MCNVRKGQFDWGGRLLNCNGVAQKIYTKKIFLLYVCNSKNIFDCEAYWPSRESTWILVYALCVYISYSCGFGYSDQVIPRGSVHRLTNKRYIRDNRLILFSSPYRKEGLAPRCRLIATRS